MRKIRKTSKIYEYTVLIVGLFIYALSYTLFLKNANIVAGDVDGIANIFKSQIDPNLMVTILCAFLLIISFPLLGKKTSIYSKNSSLT